MRQQPSVVGLVFVAHVSLFTSLATAPSGPHTLAMLSPAAASAPNYALKRTVREEVSGAIMRCGPHGRLA
jgi:hypothetical protein